MDSNLINIDDLFKQRLGGGEEPERDGAWMRMKVLLEDDERRKPAGFWWRRAVGFSGAIALLATATWGSYEAVTAFRNPASGNEEAIGMASGVTANGNAVSSVATASEANSNSSTASNANKQKENNTLNNRPDTKSVASKYPSKHTAKKHTSSNTNNRHTTTTAVNVAETHSAAGTSADQRTNSLPPKQLVSRTELTEGSSTSQIANEQVTAINSVSANNPAIVHIDQAAAAIKHNKPVQHKRRSNVQSSRSADKTVAANLLPAEINSEVGQSRSSASNTTAKHSSVSRAVAHKHQPSASSTAAKAEGSLVKEQSGASATTSQNTGRSQTSSQQKLVSRLKERAAKNNTASGNGKAAGITAAVTTSTSGLASANKQEEPLHQLSASATSRNHATGKVVDKTVSSLANVVTTNSEETTTVKKNVRQITMKQTVSGSITGTPVARLDTINDKNLTLEETTVRHRSTSKDAGSENDTETNSTTANVGNNGTTGSKTAIDAKTAKTGTSGSGLTPAHSNISKQPASTPLLASAPPKSVNLPEVAPVPAAPPVAPAAPDAAKPAEVVKKKTGMHFLQKLSMAFNDLKMNVANAQVGTGLTGGINATFFGPNSFKGFQFGGVANFVFDDKWSASAELKYFNRMNNNYAMHVTYDKYEQVSGGYMMETKDKAYSFSTLHSFELPVALRYTYKNITFLAGANFLYSMAINPGDNEVSKDPNMLPVFVTTIGPNSTPSLNGSSDFGARVGLGYLFGFNFKVAPNVNLDLRNVQTFWDNASGKGAIKVSEQLYKSPSLQFSIIYRLGHGSED